MQSRLSRKLLVILFALALLAGVFVYSDPDDIMLSGIYGEPHTPGTFHSRGNAGIISFNDTPSGYTGAQIINMGGSPYMTGIFWIETVGWSSFSDSLVSLIPPSAGANIRDPWYLSGYIWSPNAGYIALNHGESYASGVAFIPDTHLLVGYGYNDTLGWIPFGEYTPASGGVAATGTGVGVAVTEGFIGKVDVIGAIGGSKTFNVLYDVGGSFNTASMTAFVNLVRKNTTLLIRNAGSRVNTNLSGVSPVAFNEAMIFQVANNPSAGFLTYSTIKASFDNVPVSRSIIVIGGDIYIDVDATATTMPDHPRAIISLKNEKGEGGNIWVKGSVKKIEATLFAEKTIWSGEEFIPGTLSPYYVSKKSVFLDIPRNQLYIKGGIGGHNTIGGGSKNNGAVCPYSEDSCTYDTAVKYDWNYFRIYNASPARRAYINSSKDDHSVIVEYDPRILSDPPPGLETRK